MNRFYIAALFLLLIGSWMISMALPLTEDPSGRIYYAAKGSIPLKDNATKHPGFWLIGGGVLLLSAGGCAFSGKRRS
ncbi:MAG: hypothetical protein WC381_11570 [Kiritimatiellia bacterium]|jgi:hypothetical protein